MSRARGFSIRSLLPSKSRSSAKEVVGEYVGHVPFYEDTKGSLSAERMSQDSWDDAPPWNLPTKRSGVKGPKPMMILPGRQHRASPSPPPSLVEVPQSSSSSLYSCDPPPSAHRAHGTTSPALCTYHSGPSPDIFPPSPPPDALIKPDIPVQERRPGSGDLKTHTRALTPQFVNPPAGLHQGDKVIDTSSADTVRILLVEGGNLIGESTQRVNPPGDAPTGAEVTSEVPCRPEGRAESRNTKNQRISLPALSLVSSRRFTEPPNPPVSPRSSQPSRPFSIYKKATRRKSVKARPRPESLSFSPKRGSARWTRADTMVFDLFHMRKLWPIEADEMVTRAQIEQVRQRRLSREQWNMLEEVQKSVAETENPSEPFDPDNLSTRVGAAAGGELEWVRPLPCPSSTEISPASRHVNHPQQQEPTQQPSETTESEQQNKRLSTNTTTYPDAASPLPPMRTSPPPCLCEPKTLLLPLPGSLPTIPEASPIAAPGDAPVIQPGNSRAAYDFRPTATDEHIFFRSTPFSLTAPGFRHGRVRLNRCDLELEEAQMVVPDTTLDWTAYQMAILGGAGDYFSESTDYTRPDDADEIDDLFRWYQDLGLGGDGGGAPSPMAQAVPRRTSSSSTTSSFSSSSSSTSPASDSPWPSPHDNPSPATPAAPPGRCWQDLPIPVSPLKSWAWGRRRARGVPGRLQVHVGRAANLVVPDAGAGGGQQQQQQNRESVVSMPDSPLPNLVMSKGADGEEYVVSMGCNLGHDLPDFLEWQHLTLVTAGGDGPC